MMANSIAISIAHMPAAKLLVNPSTPASAATIRISLIPIAKAVKYLVPSLVKRLARYCCVYFSERRLLMVSALALGKTTARAVKYPQYFLISGINSYQEESAASVIPGPLMRRPQKTVLMAVQSSIILEAVQLGLRPNAANWSPLSTSYMLNGCPVCLQMPITKLAKLRMQLVLVKSAACMSQPRLAAQPWVVFQRYCAMLVRRDWDELVERSRVQLFVVLVSWLAVVQLYLQPTGMWMAWSKLPYQLPQTLELERQFWKRLSLNLFSNQSKRMDRPTELPYMQELVWMIEEDTKLTVETTCGETNVMRSRPIRTFIVKAIIEGQANVLLDLSKSQIYID